MAQRDLFVARQERFYVLHAEKKNLSDHIDCDLLEAVPVAVWVATKGKAINSVQAMK